MSFQKESILESISKRDRSNDPMTNKTSARMSSQSKNKDITMISTTSSPKQPKRDISNLPPIEIGRV